MMRWVEGQPDGEKEGAGPGGPGKCVPGGGGAKPAAGQTELQVADRTVVKEVKAESWQRLSE